MYCAVMNKKDLVAASSRPLVLALLAQGESYGYEIIQKIRELSREEIDWNEGMLYPVLHRLEREDLITAEWKKSENGRERKYYRLTPGGRKALASEKTDWMTVHNTLERLWKTIPSSI
jgi:DNA-binding PadR family transcriptional regulator